ncbi:hypothetical protein TRIUR3_18334 [Triticum urartu]|uniref:Knottins-like domain-containing protein n=2 Tax=Triticum urartu TaxID=4572 RepID=M7ZXJ7_TRIUA|nr:hypothetical protein TRIUR3_18334 [Triticum urartu]
MEVLKVPSLPCLVFLMLLLLAPGFDAKTCQERSESYTPFRCLTDPCVEACHKEGFIDGKCVIFKCYCKAC